MFLFPWNQNRQNGKIWISLSSSVSLSLSNPPSYMHYALKQTTTKHGALSLKPEEEVSVLLCYFYQVSFFAIRIRTQSLTLTPTPTACTTLRPYRSIRRSWTGICCTSLAFTRQPEKWRLSARRTATSTSSIASSTSNSASSSTLCFAPPPPPTTSPLPHRFLLSMPCFEGWESEELEEEWTKEAIMIRSPGMTWRRCQIWLRVWWAWLRAEGSRMLMWSLPLRMTIGFDDLEKSERLSSWGWRLKGGGETFHVFFLSFFLFSAFFLIFF